MMRFSSGERSSLKEKLVFLVFAALWVAGQGTHLSANSVNNLAESLAKNHVLDILSSNIYTLTYFYDEHLSHHLWPIGVMGLAAWLQLPVENRPLPIAGMGSLPSRQFPHAGLFGRHITTYK